MKKKALLAVLISMILCMATAIPAWAASPSQDDSTTGAVLTVQAAQDGAWTINKKSGTYVTKAQKKLFNQALKGYTGVTFEPVFVVATQVVAGTNYAYFCKASTVTKNPKTSWKVVVVNKNLKGKATVKAINNFYFKKISTLKNAPASSNMPGAWKNITKKYTPEGIPASALKAFNKANAKYVGVDLTPLVLLSTQTVAGTNYRYLCRGVVPGAKAVNYYAVDVYKNLKGVAKITSCKPVNMEKYLAY